MMLHKMVGYGLVDVGHDGSGITDPRINTSSPLLSLDGTLDSYAEFLSTVAARRDPSAAAGELAWIREARAGSRKYQVDPVSACLYNPDMGLPDVLCLRPVWATDWHRSDDTIDLVEESHFGPGAGDPQPRADVIPHGIWPFNGAYVDVRTGHRLSDNVMHWIRARSAGRQPGDEGMWDLARAIRWRADTAAEVTLFDETPVFDDDLVAAAFIAPEVPVGVRLLAEWGQLFTEGATVWQLRPMRYIWWS
jgi:hypothetical protein